MSPHDAVSPGSLGEAPRNPAAGKTTRLHFDLLQTISHIVSSRKRKNTQLTLTVSIG